SALARMDAHHALPATLLRRHDDPIVELPSPTHRRDVGGNVGQAAEPGLPLDPMAPSTDGLQSQSMPLDRHRRPVDIEGYLQGALPEVLDCRLEVTEVAVDTVEDEDRRPRRRAQDQQSQGHSRDHMRDGGDGSVHVHELQKFGPLREPARPGPSRDGRSLVSCPHGDTTLAVITPDRASVATLDVHPDLAETLLPAA